MIALIAVYRQQWAERDAGPPSDILHVPRHAMSPLSRIIQLSLPHPPRGRYARPGDEQYTIYM